MPEETTSELLVRRWQVTLPDGSVDEVHAEDLIIRHGTLKFVDANHVVEHTYSPIGWTKATELTPTQED